MATAPRFNFSQEDTSYDDDSWLYLSRSTRGARVYGDAAKRSLPHDGFNLEYNSTDKMLLEKAKLEVRQSLERARTNLGIESTQDISPSDAIGAVIPRHFLEQFHEYLQSSLDKDERQSWSFQDIGSFIRCESLMRLFSCSESELRDFGVGVHIFNQYKVVRQALTKSDQPASSRKVIDGAAQLPACSFDPIIQDAIDALNKHLTWLFFVRGNSWADVDDDKIPNCSPLFKEYGMKMTPTKDKKLKPVFHVMAVIGAGYITYVTPDLVGLKLSEMLKKAIEHVSPNDQKALRATMALFIIDRGYLELCQAQGVEVAKDKM